MHNSMMRFRDELIVANEGGLELMGRVKGLSAELIFNEEREGL